MLERIADGRTDLVFDYVAEAHPANSTGGDGVSLIKWCAYYGDVSAIRFLLDHGASLQVLGENLDLNLNGAAFHGHWQLCQFLIEKGADVNHPLPETGETPLHAALCKANRPVYNEVVKMLLDSVTKASAETGCFMRDCRTKAETPLHRAAAFGSEEAIDMLLGAGATIDARDMSGDSPLTWASWHLRPDAILRNCVTTASPFTRKAIRPTIMARGGASWELGNRTSSSLATPTASPFSGWAYGSRRVARAPCA